jgi:hypothetical protein
MAAITRIIKEVTLILSFSISYVVKLDIIILKLETHNKKKLITHGRR